MENLTFDNTSNETMNTTVLPCAEKRLLGGPMNLNPSVVEVLRYIQAILFIVAFPIALFLNTFVIILVVKVKRLHQTSFYLALQVIVVDLLITLIQFPTTTANVIANSWVLGAVGCPTLGFLLFTLRNMRNFLMFVFVTDRLLSVFAPYWYYKRNHRKLIVIPLSVAAWVFAIIYGLIPMPFLLDCHEYSNIAWGCTISKGCKYPEICDAYKNASIVLSNIIGGFVPLIMYIVLYCKARQLKKRLPKFSPSLDDSSLQQRSDSLASPTESRKQSIVSFLSSFDSHLTTTLAKMIEKRRKRDEKANVTFAILFIALIGVSFPSLCFFIIGTSAFSAQKIPPPEAFVILSIIFRTLFNFLVIIDPIAIMRNRDVKIALEDIYKQLKNHLKGESKPIYTTEYNLSRQTDQANSIGRDVLPLNFISEENDNVNVEPGSSDGSQKNVLDLNGAHSKFCESEKAVCEGSVTFEIVEYKIEPRSQTLSGHSD